MLGTNGTLAVSSYMIPDKFNTVKDILSHWDDEVSANGDSSNTKWRFYLSYVQKKRFTRMRRIIWWYSTQVLRDPISEDNVLLGFEEYFLANTHSFFKLSNVCLRTLPS